MRSWLLGPALLAAAFVLAMAARSSAARALLVLAAGLVAMTAAEFVYRVTRLYRAQAARVEYDTYAAELAARARTRAASDRRVVAGPMPTAGAPAVLTGGA